MGQCIYRYRKRFGSTLQLKIGYMKTLHFIAGLPRAGSTMMSNILKQNPQIHSEAISSLFSLVGSIHANWYSYGQNQEYRNEDAKMGVLRGIVSGYYSHIDRNIIFDKDRGWIHHIALLEEIFQRPVKILCMVRNPAEILASFEKLRKNNPTFFSLPDQSLREGSTIASRAMFYAGPNGTLGLAHSHLRDAITQGYLDKLLFIDYNRYCSNPKSQTKRIYDFFELPHFDHNFQNIEQTEEYNDLVNGLVNLHKVKPKLEKTSINPVEYLGLDLYQQYNSEIFWDAWI
jgi:sulfotransferase